MTYINIHNKLHSILDISTRNNKPRIQLLHNVSYVTNNKTLLLIINKAEREIYIYLSPKVLKVRAKG